MKGKEVSEWRDERVEGIMREIADVQPLGNPTGIIYFLKPFFKDDEPTGFLELSPCKDKPKPFQQLTFGLED